MLAEKTMELQKNRPIKLKDLNKHITCFICNGYLVDATTITECIHSFCRSCLISHIESNNNKCPKCNVVIHHSYPLLYIDHDRTMQDIVEKLVPNFKEREKERRLKFYTDNKLPIPEELTLEVKHKTHRTIHTTDDGKVNNYHRFDDQIDICLRNADCSMKPLKRPFLQCSVNATIKILKKYLAKNLGAGMQRHGDLDILCNNEILGKDHTLRFILVTRWRSKNPPLHLEYRPRITLL